MLVWVFFLQSKRLCRVLVVVFVPIRVGGTAWIVASSCAFSAIISSVRRLVASRAAAEPFVRSSVACIKWLYLSISPKSNVFSIQSFFKSNALIWKEIKDEGWVCEHAFTHTWTKITIGIVQSGFYLSCGQCRYITAVVSRIADEFDLRFQLFVLRNWPLRDPWSAEVWSF